MISTVVVEVFETTAAQHLMACSPEDNESGFQTLMPTPVRAKPHTAPSHPFHPMKNLVRKARKKGFNIEMKRNFPYKVPC